MAKNSEQIQKRWRVQLNAVKNRHGITDKEIALMMGMTVTQADLVRKMRAGDATIQADRIILLSQNLVQEYNDMIFLQDMVPDGWLAFAQKGSASNNRIDDEINQITRYSGRIIEILSRYEGDTACQLSPDDKEMIRGCAKMIAAETATIAKEVR